MQVSSPRSTTTSVTAALAGAELPATGNDLKVSYDFTSKTAGAYPITALSYEIVCTKAKDAAKQALAEVLPHLRRHDRSGLRW